MNGSKSLRRRLVTSDKFRRTELHPIQARVLKSIDSDALVYYTTINDACFLIVAVRSGSNWAAFSKIYDVSFNSDNSEILCLDTARFGDRLPRKIAEAIFNDYNNGWGNYKEDISRQLQVIFV